jgi:Tol biopolymer transport system component
MLDVLTEGVADWEQSSWTLDVGTSKWHQLTDRVDGPSAWSPDGRWLLVPAKGDLFIVPAASLEAEPIHDPEAAGGRRLTTDGNHKWAAWSPDGSLILLMARDANEEGGGPIEILDVASGDRKQLVNPGCSPGWSPDGRSVAYVTGRRGDRDVPPTGTPGDRTAFAAWTLELGSSKARAVGRAWFGPKLAPDGSQVLLDTSTGLFVRLADGTGQPTRLTPVGLWPAEYELGWRTAELVCGELVSMEVDWQAIPRVP